jgi:hypothetical protein
VAGVQRPAAAASPPLAPPPPPPPPAAAVSSLEGLDDIAPAEAASAGGSVSEGDRPLTSVPPLPPLDFVAFAASFLAWWTCGVTCLFTYPLMFVYRAGLHVG